MGKSVYEKIKIGYYSDASPEKLAEFKKAAMVEMDLVDAYAGEHAYELAWKHGNNLYEVLDWLKVFGDLIGSAIEEFINYNGL